MKRISLLVPVYNESSNIKYFINEVSPIISKLSNTHKLEIVFSDNASTDNTLDEIKKINLKLCPVKYISLSRNFGYQASILALLNNVESDAYIVIDVDCEDPPKLILEFIAHFDKGYKYVYGIRKWRDEKIIIILLRKFFYRLTKLLADSDFILDVAEFSLFDNKIKRSILHTQSTFPFIRSEIAYCGFKKIGIEYKRNNRKHGISNYNFIQMFKFAIAGILSSTTFPLRLITYLGLPALILLPFFMIFYEFNNSIVFLLTLIYLIFSLMSISIYLARTYKNSLRKPLFIIDSYSDNMKILKDIY